MVWRILLAMAALAIFADDDACAQAANATPPTAPDQTAPDQQNTVQECIMIRELHEKIVVGRSGKGIVLWLGGGACDLPGSSGISDLSAGFATNGGMEDIIEEENCPAFQTRINKLWAARQHTQHGYGTIPGVRAGPFTITDSSDLFDLKSPEGRRAAARWINQTLAAVRPCWDTVRDDRTHYVVDLLYGDLRRSAPAAIDAAIAQDQRQEYRRLHALSPEAQARRDEDRQLKAAVGEREADSEGRRRQMRTGARPWIAIEGVAMDRVERESNGPDISVALRARIKNAGSAPTVSLWTHLDLISFVHLDEHSWAQRRLNVCNELMDSGPFQTRVDHAIEPGETFSLKVTENRGAFYPNDTVYGDSESDYLAVVGCVKYSFGYPEQRASSTFAYVVGRRINGKLVRFTRGDGVMFAKDLRWLSLHQDYEQ
jgi:hypothetical protein